MNNATRARKCLVSAALLASAFGLWTCGGKVVLDQEYGEGGGGATASSQSSQESSQESSQSSTGGSLPNNCTDESCAGLGSDKCSCVRTCGASQYMVKCAPNENQKFQCVCSYDGDFSGACFETKPEVACNMDKGCCAKYFMGI